MDNNWGVQDSDWQLRRLQQDCVRSSDRALAALYTTLQQEVRQVHAEYQRNFGPNSAQFAEYISLLVQKLQTAGAASAACMEWLNSAASGVLPAEHVPANYNSQSQTLTYIPGEYRVQMELTGDPAAMPDDAEFDSQAVADLIAQSPEVSPPSAPAPAVQAPSSFQNIPMQNVVLPQTSQAMPSQSTSSQSASFDNPWGDSPDPPQVQRKSGLNSLMPSTWENGQNISAANQFQKVSGDWSAPSQAASISGSNQAISGEQPFPAAMPPANTPIAAPIAAPVAAPIATPAPSPISAPAAMFNQLQMPQQPGFAANNGDWGQPRSVSDAWGVPSQQEIETPPAPAPVNIPAPQSMPSPVVAAPSFNTSFNSPQPVFNPQSTLPLDGAWGVPQEQSLQTPSEQSQFQQPSYQQQPFQQQPAYQQQQESAYQQQQVAYQQQQIAYQQQQQQPYKQNYEDDRQEDKDYSYDPATAWD